MKIAKVSLMALSIVAAGSVFAQVAGPDTKTLVECNNAVFNCDQRERLESNKVDHKLSKMSYERVIFAVKSRPAPEKTIFIVKEETTKPTAMVVDSYYVVEPVGPTNTWAYLPK